MFNLRDITQRLIDSRDLYDMAREESDEETLESVEQDAAAIEQIVAQLEFQIGRASCRERV